MNKITFKVSTQKDYSVAALIKEVNKISCKIRFDLENGIVAVENVNDTMVDSVIDLINNYYTILGVEIDNTFGETTENQAVTAVEDIADEALIEKQSTVLEPQSEDDLIIKKVEFENEYVENRINSFLKTAYWALYNRRATEKDIGEYILTCMTEISMRYYSKPIIEFSIGDIVDVNYGSHLPGEIMGGHVHAIVCNILNENMAYVVPITKVRSDISSLSYLFMDAPQDATYNNEYYKGGTVLVEKGKYVRVERFNSVIGKTNPEFFEKLLHQLVSTFDFTNCIVETDDEESELPFTIGETNAASDEIVDKTVETAVATDDTTKKVGKPKKVGGEEAALLEAIGFAFDKLDNSQKVEEQVESFLTDIGMTTNERLVTQSFMIACNIKKINYENVILELHNLNSDINEDVIETNLKETFKSWLKQYPELAAKCPKLSLMSVLKVFAKRFA